MTFHTACMLAFLLAPSLAAAAEVVPPAPEPDVLRDWEAVKGRFHDRAIEIEGDARGHLAVQKTEQKRALDAKFAARLKTQSATERALRDDAITRFEQFLAQYDDVRLTSDVRLRLAELQFQKADEDWLTATAAHETELDAAGDDLDALARIEAQGSPRIDLSRVVELLDGILDANRGLAAEDRYPLLDVAYSMLAFAYADDNSAQFDRERARRIFGELIAARPDSEYADAAHLMLGNYAFTDNRYADAIPEFQAVVAKGPTHVHFAEALYQLAWSRYKLSEYDTAMKGFVEILDLSEASKRETGKGSDFASDAVAYLALSLSDMADAKGVTPAEEATAFFDQVGHRPWRWDVMRELAESLVRYARPRDAVDLYKQLQRDPEFKNRPENPEFQDQVVKLLSRGYDADLAAAGQGRIEMTERYGESSSWWAANRNDPEAQTRARKFIESYLLDVATEVKVRAQESCTAPPDSVCDTKLYSIAADKYLEYLEKFPISDDWFPNQFQMADALYRANRFEEADKAFTVLVENARFHDYGDAALYMLFRTREQLLKDRVGPPDVHAAAAQVERAYEGANGEPISVYRLLDDQRKFVDIADAVLAHTFGPPVEEVDLQSIVDKNRAKILYIPAQILFYANRFEEARPRLQKVIKEFPQTDEAAYAANLFLNSYIVEGDNESIRRWSREFAGMRLGSSAASKAGQSTFDDAYEKASYYLGTEAYERGDYQAAADAYLAFVDEFPKSKNVPDALLSAAFNEQRLGRAADANALYERFLHDFPDHPEAKPYYFAIASNYESTFQLDRAIGYYGEYVKRFPKDPEAPTAQYMVAFLQEGLGNYAAAAKGYEAYAAQYPTVADREDVHFRAGRMYELADRDAAIAFYGRYLKTYGTGNADHALAAQARIADLLAEDGRGKSADKARADVAVLFDRIVAAGGTVGPRGRDLAAAAAFRPLDARFTALAAHRLGSDEAKNSKLLLDDLPQEIAAFDADVAAFVQKYLSFEYTAAGLYLQGAARAAYAKLGFSLVPPAGLDEDAQAAYWELLEETMFPEMEKVEAQATAYYTKVLDLARDQKRWSGWVDKARAGLHAIDPSAWPDAKNPLRGKVEAIDVPVIAPLAPPAPPEPPAEVAPAQPTEGVAP